jgi:hypothetical protein
MPPAAFEPAIPAGERPQTQALDRTATGIPNKIIRKNKYKDENSTTINQYS